MSDWKSFVIIADEFVISYANPPFTYAIMAKSFIIGHTVELYLKAVYIKQTGEIDKVIWYGHKIDKLLLECKRNDEKFLPSYDLREHILNTNLLRPEDLKNILGKDDFLHFLQHQDLYIIAKYIQDLKYFGTKMKNHSGGEVAVTWQYPNIYFAELIRQIRNYLGCNTDRKSSLHFYLEDNNERIPQSARNFLERIME